MTHALLCWALPFLSLFVALSLSLPCPLPACSEQEGAEQAVEELIRHLGDKRPVVREAATRRLLELKDATPALRAALKSPDPEIARRAAWILEEVGRRPGRQALARFTEHVKNGEIDQAVECFVWRSQWEDDKACWQVLTGLAADLIERGRKEFGEVVPRPSNWLPAGDLERYLKAVRPSFFVGSRVWPAKLRKPDGVGIVLRGKDVVVEGASVDAALIACAGGLRARELSLSVIYASGPVELRMLHNSVLICDGDLTVTSVAHSLVIVRGDVHCVKSGAVSSSLVIMSGRFHLGKYETLGKTAKLREGQTKFLDFVKFFDPVREGIEVEAAKRGVRVKTVEASKLFAKSGLQVGDVITAVDKQATADPEAFRRQLRSALAREAFTLQVARGDESRQIRISTARVSQPPAAPQGDSAKTPPK
ncbi:MAG TPA: PDZ domain-containing protein [Gemmataceae bacterium]|nr:PDZ domain-containing protein [Gemmataceae bacterium]